MIKYSGIALNEKCIVGKISLYGKHINSLEKRRINSVEEELSRLSNAIELAEKELSELFEKTIELHGPSIASLMEAQQLILRDEFFLGEIRKYIARELVGAEYATIKTGDLLAAKLSSIDDDYMSIRAADILDVASRLSKIILNSVNEFDKSEVIVADSESEGQILVADELSTSEMIQLDKNRISAIVLLKGAVNSHASIIARSMDIPVIINVGISEDALKDRIEAAIDGENSLFIIEPDDKCVEDIKGRIKKQSKRLIKLDVLKDLPSVTKSGQTIKLSANIGSLQDAEAAVINGAEGIGLFRSEFLYLGREDAPSEEEQFTVYKSVLEMLGDKEVIVRTVDLGADKTPEYMGIKVSDNSALGLRAIRMCLTHKDIFRTQLRALLRAACYGELKIMYPMIISVEELEEVKGELKIAASELKSEGISYRIPAQGIMIETPAAAIISDKLASMVDFFSIGTNDLTQYTLALDREGQVDYMHYDAYHEAVIKLIELSVNNAKEHGISVGICGELGADSGMISRFVGMGVDELSVAPSNILPIKKIIRDTVI